jgi:hypothetical protein
MERILLGWMLLAAIVFASTRSARATNDERSWQFDIAAPYLWVPEEHGRIGLGPVSVPVNVGFDDVFDLMGDGELLGGAGHFEAHNRELHLSLFFDATGAVVDTEGSIARLPGGKVDVDSSLVFLEWAAGYRLGPWPLDRPATRKFWVEPFVGARYIYIANSVELRQGGVPIASASGSTEWADPILGIRWSLGLLPRLALRFRADIGGFGAGSELAWSLNSLFEYALPWTLFSAPLVVGAGYKVLDFDYESGSGRFDKEIDLEFRGPLLGLGLRF